MNGVAKKWWWWKLALVVFLMAQFYLAKRYREPYPCIIMPSFAQAFPVDAQAVATTYSFLLLEDTSIDTLELGQLLPHVPPNYGTFTAEGLFELSPIEQAEWQLYLLEELQPSSPAILRIERWECSWPGNDLRVPLQSELVGVREIRIGDEI